MNEAATLIWILVGIVVVLLLLFSWAVFSLVKVRMELGKLNKTLEGLEGRLGEQERRLAEVQASLDKKGGDAFLPFVEAFQSFKTKGWLPALALLGGHLFRSYLGKRRQKALPPKNDP
jgi:hypothetical protein